MFTKVDGRSDWLLREQADFWLRFGLGHRDLRYEQFDGGAVGGVDVVGEVERVALDADLVVDDAVGIAVRVVRFGEGVGAVVDVVAAGAYAAPSSEPVATSSPAWIT